MIPKNTPLKKLVPTTILLLCAATANAGQATGLIETIEVGPGNGTAVLVKMQSGRVGAPGCQQSTALGRDTAEQRHY